MKKILLIAAVFLTFFGCEKKYDNVVSITSSSFQVNSVKPFTAYDYTYTDSSLVLTLAFYDTTGIKNVNYKMYSSAGNVVNSGEMFDNGKVTNGDEVIGDAVYSAKTIMKQMFPNGKYSIEYFVTDQYDISKYVASQSFNYFNHQDNKAPVLSNLVMADSIEVMTETAFSVKASDSNGLSDIKEVYFEVYRPDGTMWVGNNGISKTDLLDNGNQSNGDLVEGDGIYSFKNIWSTTSQKGIWRFEFQCIDRSNVVSNKIIHNIKVL